MPRARTRPASAAAEWVTRRVPRIIRRMAKARARRPTASPTLDSLTRRVLRHRDERDWGQFHTPKELAVSLVVESAELLALMQWKTGDALTAAVRKRREQIRDELADVLHSTLLLADDLGVDLAEALEHKLIKDAKKYPVEKARGRAEKYTDL
jgi:NTP pyrophosphatase (non-canonical NTP hydrolase)